MGAPVIVDDGGSTRIKQIIAGTNMDGLLDLPSTAAALGPFGAAGAATCNLKVMHYKKDGSNHGATVVFPLVGGDLVEVVSENQQRLRITLDNASANLLLQLDSLAPGVTPIAEALSSNGQRRYVVTNAGPIKTVTINPGPGVQPVFDNSSFTPANKSIHTTVHLKD
jgi:hypothetical protein